MGTNNIKLNYNESSNAFTVDLANITVLCLLSLLMYWAHNYHEESFSWIQLVRLCAIALIIYQIIIVKIRKLWFLDFAVVFTACNYLFVESYLFIWEEGARRYEYWTMGYTPSQWLKAFVFGLCYIQGMFTGLLFPCKRNIMKVIKLNREYSSESIFKIGLIIFLISLPFKIYVDALTYVVNRSGSGYSAVLSNEVISGVSFNIALLVNVGVIYIICSRYLQKNKARWFFLAFFAYSLGITTLVGGRRFTVTAFLAVVSCYFYIYNVKIRKKQIFVFTILGYLGVVFLSTVSATRTLLVTSFDEYINLSIDYIMGTDVLFDFAYEFGNTIFPYIMALSVFPMNHDYIYGASLVAVWVLAIPGAGKIFPNLKDSVDPTVLLRAKYKYWFGGAFGQEIYANFGYASIGIAVLFGKIFRNFLGTLNSGSSILCARYFTFYYVFLNLVRSDLYEFVRLILWAYLLPIIIRSFLSHGK